MDDLLLFTPSKWCHMEDLLKALLKNGLNIFPKKCQLFRTNLQYTGNEIFIQNKRVYMQSLKNRLEVIQKPQPPHYSKVMQKFCGGGQFPKHVLSRVTENIKANTSLNQER